VVTLPFLARCGFVAIVLELVIAALLGPTALSWWGVVFGFTLAMRYEFGVGGWLNRHLLVYAMSHNPVVALLGCFAWASTGTAFDERYWVYLALVTLGSFAFEMGRKTRLPEEEVRGVESYSSVLGRKQAGVILAVLSIGTAAAAAGLCHLLAAEWYAYAAAGVAGVLGLWPALAGKGEKAVEGGASLLLLGAMGAAWLAT
jgi:4-hydroxybenzoate polyprenyltransferase